MISSKMRFGIILFTMKKGAIAVDLDEVLGNFVESFIDFSNKSYNTNLTFDDYSDNWQDFWDIPYSEIEKRADEFHTNENILKITPKLEAKPILKILQKEYDLFITTARRKNTLKATKTWIDDNFRGIFKGIHFVPIWEPNNKITKADICKKIGADYLIDDLVEHCNIATKYNIKSILFGYYNWNKLKKLNYGVTRCRNWPEVLNYFLKIN